MEYSWNKGTVTIYREKAMADSFSIPYQHCAWSPEEGLAVPLNLRLWGP